MKFPLVHATLMGAAILLAGCGADTKPLWYTNTDVFSAPMFDQDGNVRVLQTYAQMKSVLISPTGNILNQQPVAGTNPEYRTVHSDTDTSHNVYSYGITSALEVRKWDATGNLLFHKSIALPLNDDVTPSSARYFDAGDGRQLMQLMLSSGYPDYSPSQMLVLIDENGEQLAELAVDADARVIAASPQRALVQQNNQLVLLALPDLNPLHTITDAELGGGTVSSQIKGVATPDNQFKLLVAQADQGATPSSHANERVVLVTLGSGGEIIANLPWSGNQSYARFDIEDGSLSQFPLAHMVALNSGDIAVVEPCRSEEGCDSNSANVIVTFGDGVIRWQKQVNLPSSLPLVHASNGGTFIRLPQRADVLMSPVGLRHAQGKLWLLASSFSDGSGSETLQSLSQLWSFDSDSGQSQRHFSTFKQLLDYTVAEDSSIYVSHAGFVDGITPAGVARYE